MATGKKGLLIVPEFPKDSFWSHKYILSWGNKGASMPPLGLITFASYLSKDWDLELLDLNVSDRTQNELRKKIQRADAVFAGAMFIQFRSLVELLEGPAKGSNTPWILGGPIASTYWKRFLEPQTSAEESMCRGIDLMIWGEASLWVGQIEKFIEQNPVHSEDKPHILLPQKLWNEDTAKRKYLLDKSLFREFDHAPVPRWDLLEIDRYAHMSILTSAGCPFRCDFCDIIQFTGGFNRFKKRDDIWRELEAVYATGFRGLVFIVDDNFIGNAQGTEMALDTLIEFQRRYDYPFTFGTQASVDIGKPSHQHLIEKMRMAGYDYVFLGIENTSEKALRNMNKIQNTQVSVEKTIAMIQSKGIEVFAGFIFGNDEDTCETAYEIAEFIKTNRIPTAMTGILLPIPGTPLYARLEKEGRLLERNSFYGDDYYPKRMSIGQLYKGIIGIWETIFAPINSFERARDLVRHCDRSIFQPTIRTSTKTKAVLQSLWTQGLARRDKHYFRLLYKALAMDNLQKRRSLGERRDLQRFRKEAKGRLPVAIMKESLGNLSLKKILDYAKDGLIRWDASLSMENIETIVQEFADDIADAVERPRHLEKILSFADKFVTAKIKHARFPGSKLAHAFQLGCEAYHYEQVKNAYVEIIMTIIEERKDAEQRGTTIMAESRAETKEVTV